MRYAHRIACRGGKGRPGMAAVELALLSPLFTILIMGMFDITRVLIVKMTLDDAARKGCRTGICQRRGTTAPAPSSTGSNITQDIINILTDNGLDPTKATLTIKVGNGVPSVYSVSGTSPNCTVTLTSGPGTDPITAKGGTQLQVQVSMPFSSFNWGISAMFLSGATLVSETMTMVKQ